VAKQHESSFLYDIHEGRLFRHTPHFTVGCSIQIRTKACLSLDRCADSDSPTACLHSKRTSQPAAHRAANKAPFWSRAATVCCSLRVFV